jgi:hypothetical protein
MQTRLRAVLRRQTDALPGILRQAIVAGQQHAAKKMPSLVRVDRRQGGTS